MTDDTNDTGSSTGRSSVLDPKGSDGGDGAVDDTDTDDNTTTSEQARHPYTNDIISLIVVVTGAITWLVLLTGMATGTVAVSVPPTMLEPLVWVTATGLLMMFTWLFGRGALTTVLEAIRQ